MYHKLSSNLSAPQTSPKSRFKEENLADPRFARNAPQSTRKLTRSQSKGWHQHEGDTGQAGRACCNLPPREGGKEGLSVSKLEQYWSIMEGASSSSHARRLFQTTERASYCIYCTMTQSKRCSMEFTHTFRFKVSKSLGGKKYCF